MSKPMFEENSMPTLNLTMALIHNSNVLVPLASSLLIHWYLVVDFPASVEERREGCV